MHGNPKARQEWAVGQMRMRPRPRAISASTPRVSFTGSLAFPFLYPWPQRPAGLIEEAFDELARRWKPILDAYDEVGVDVGYEIHPGEDVFDGATFEMFLDGLGGHPRCTINYDPSHFVLQQLDYLAFIDIYHERISPFTSRTPSSIPTARQGVYSGYQPWTQRAPAASARWATARSISPASSPSSPQYDYDCWAVLEWECCLKQPEQGAAEGAPFIASHIIRVTEKAFDDFAGGETDKQQIRAMLGLK